MSETELVRAILGALKLKGMWCLRLNAGMMRGVHKGKPWVIRGVEPGTPDILCMMPNGEHIWLEAKTAKGKLSVKQKAWHKKARARGISVFVVRSVDDALEAVNA